MCKYYKNPRSEKHYYHQPEPITEAKEATILWDFAIQTDRKIKNNRPDIIVKDYKKKNMPFNWYVSANR